MEKYPLKILFITRAYPPIIGGMEKLSYNLTTNIGRFIEKSFIIANKKGRSFLPFFIFTAIFKGLFLSRKADVIHLSDPTLSLVGFFIKIFYPQKPLVITLHGLDITYQDKKKQKDLKKHSLFEKIFNYKVYGFYLKMFLKADLFICISRATELEAIKKGLKKTTVIPVGINPDEYFLKEKLSHKVLSEILKTEPSFLDNKNILVTVGRLVKRKGVRWFIVNVLPKLSDDYIYLVIGKGVEKERIKKAVEEGGGSKRVFLLGSIFEDKLKIIYNMAHLFVMPNIKVKGDFEGFGIVALEAASSSLPVLAADIEGIKDAVFQEKNGFLTESGSADKFVSNINNLFRDKKKLKEFGEKAREYTIQKFSWHKISIQYIEAFQRLIK